MRRLPPLGALRVFESVARLRSFRSAADELGVTPTAISHQIKGLESYCGQTLFRRRPRPLALTGAGERLYPMIRDGLDLFAAGVNQLRPPLEPARRLRVSTTNAFAALCLVPMLPHWHRERPDIELEIIGTDRVLDLRSGETDVAIRYARDEPRDGQSVELARDRFHVVAAPALLGPAGTAGWYRLPKISYDWLPDDQRAPTWQYWEIAAGTDPGGHARVAMHFHEELHAIEAVLAGQGVALCSDLLVRDALADGSLVCLSPVSLDGYGLYMVSLPGQSAAGPVADFRAWMQRTFGQAGG